MEYVERHGPFNKILKFSSVEKADLTKYGDNRSRGLTDKITHRVFPEPRTRTGAEAPVHSAVKLSQQSTLLLSPLPSKQRQHHQTKHQLGPFTK